MLHIFVQLYYICKF